MKGVALLVLLTIMLLSVPVAAVHISSHAAFLSYELGPHSNDTIQIFFVIENIEDVVARTNIQSIWDFGDGLNTTLNGTGKLGTDVNTISHSYRYPGAYAVNVTLFINRYSNEEVYEELSIILNLATEEIRNLDRQAFLTGLQSSVVRGLWVIIPLFFAIWFTSKFIFNAPNAARWFRIGWILTTSIFLSFFVAPWFWFEVYDFTNP